MVLPLPFPLPLPLPSSTALPQAMVPKPNISLSSSILSAILSRLPSIPKPATTTTTATVVPTPKIGTELNQHKVPTPKIGTELNQPKVPTPKIGTELNQHKVPTPKIGTELNQHKVPTPKIGTELNQPKTHYSHAAPVPVAVRDSIPIPPATVVKKAEMELKRSDEKGPIPIPILSSADSGTEVKVIAQSSNTVPMEKEPIPKPKISSRMGHEANYSGAEPKTDDGNSIEVQDSAEVDKGQGSEVEGPRSSSSSSSEGLATVAMATDSTPPPPPPPPVEEKDGGLVVESKATPSISDSSSTAPLSEEPRPLSEEPRPPIVGGGGASVPVEFPKRRVGKVCMVCLRVHARMVCVHVFV